MVRHVFRSEFFFINYAVGVSCDVLPEYVSQIKKRLKIKLTHFFFSDVSELLVLRLCFLSWRVNFFKAEKYAQYQNGKKVKVVFRLARKFWVLKITGCFIVQWPLICQKIKGILVSQFMTPLSAERHLTFNTNLKMQNNPIYLLLDATPPS